MAFVTAESDFYDYSVKKSGASFQRWLQHLTRWVANDTWNEDFAEFACLEKRCFAILRARHAILPGRDE